MKLRKNTSDIISQIGQKMKNFKVDEIGEAFKLGYSSEAFFEGDDKAEGAGDEPRNTRKSRKEFKGQELLYERRRNSHGHCSHGRFQLFL